MGSPSLQNIPKVNVKKVELILDLSRSHGCSNGYPQFLWVRLKPIHDLVMHGSGCAVIAVDRHYIHRASRHDDDDVQEGTKHDKVSWFAERSAEYQAIAFNREVHPEVYGIWNWPWGDA